jgi:hypothetical protein
MIRGLPMQGFLRMQSGDHPPPSFVAPRKDFRVIHVGFCAAETKARAARFTALRRSPESMVERPMHREPPALQPQQAAADFQTQSTHEK